jgi:protease I
MSRVAILLADGFEDRELEMPRTTLLDESHAVDVLASTVDRELVGKHGARCPADRLITEADPGDYDAVVIPGGHAPDRLRLDPSMVSFVADMTARGRPVAAICHGGSLLIEADVVSGRRVTSWPSIATDLRNAGAEWVDEEVVTDANLITSRRPGDLPAFVAAILAALGDEA